MALAVANTKTSTAAFLDGKFAYGTVYTSAPSGNNPGTEPSGGSPAFARKALTWTAGAAGVATASATFDIPASTINGSGLCSAASDLAAPVLSAPSTANTGGTLAAATYFYKATYTNANGETIGSNEISQATTGTTSTTTFTIGAAPGGATGMKIYRSTTTGSEVLLDTLATTPTTYTDNGSKTPGSATVPTANTTTYLEGRTETATTFSAQGTLTVTWTLTVS